MNEYAVFIKRVPISLINLLLYKYIQIDKMSPVNFLMVSINKLQKKYIITN